MRKRVQKPVGHEHLGHTITLEPTCKQAERLARATGCSRFAYNWGLAEWDRQYRAGEKPSTAKLAKQFNSIRREAFPWTYDSPRDATSEAFQDLGKAFSAFFASQSGERKGPKIGYPTCRKRGKDDSFYVANDQFCVDGDRIRLPRIGFVKMTESLRLSGKIMSARVKREAGRWYVSIAVQGEFRRPVAHQRSIVGVDLGVKTAIVPSHGEPIESPKPLASALKRLRRANRVLHRRKKGGQNRYKARMRVAKIHQHVANVRRDWAHKVTTKLCRENQAIVIENLNVSGMLKNERLARAISDVGFGMIRVFLTYKGRIFNCNVQVADRWFPSSKRCHRCGNEKHILGLSERVYTCDACGLIEDRDSNASKNLEQYPRLAGNWGRKARTPMDDCISTRLGRASAVDEVGTKPCSLVTQFREQYQQANLFPNSLD